MRGRIRATSLATIGAYLALAPAAKATERAPSFDRPCEPPVRGARLHDGFFVRAEAGVAVLRAAVRAPDRTFARALGQSSSLSIGGTPAPGLVLGGSIWAARLDPSFVEHGQTIVPDDDSVKLTFARVGPFLSFYPNPRRGFHADAALSLMLAVESDEKGNPIEPGFSGPALSLGLGQEWFVASSFSLGLLGRATFSRVARDTSEGAEHMFAESFELALSYTYH